MLLKDGILCDYKQEVRGDVRISGGKIEEIGENLLIKEDEKVLDCKGKYVMPSIIDMAYPKNKTLSRKNLESLTQKALKGGVGSVLLLPESSPSIDYEAIIELVLSLDSALSVHFMPSIAPYRDGRISEIISLVSSGARAMYINQCLQGNINGYMLQIIAQYAKMLDIPIIACPQEASLSEGVINEGAISAKLGLSGISPLAQRLEVGRLCEMARYSGTKWLFDVISEKESLEMLDIYKNLGANVLAQTSIHHLILSDEDCAEFDTRFKLFPPLKDAATRKYLQKSLNSKIDMLTCLQSDSYNSLKDQVFDNASFGINAFSLYFSLGVEYLVKRGLCSLSRFSELTSYAQSCLLGLNKGAIEIGKDADLMVVDLAGEVCVGDGFSPYFGRKLGGEVCGVIASGEVVFGDL